ncbi:MAG TPA: hypothetical protein VG871_22720 [Vicinamibacterales bacterium]|nr:hypothetical protein [Vicinamibacterales bacterium]
MATDLVGFTDVCVDGTRVSAPWGDGAPAELHVQEPGKPMQIIALPDRAIYVSAERVTLGALPSDDDPIFVAWNSQSDGEPGRWWRSDTGAVQTLELLHGEYPVVVTRDGSIEYMPASGGGRSTVTLLPSGERTSQPCALTSQGFAGYDDDWTAVRMDDVMSVTLGGLTFARAWRHGEWTVGGDVHADRILAYHHPTATPYVVANVQTSIGPRVRTMDDGSAVVAISLPGLWVTSAQFAAYTPPPVTIPTFPAQQASVLVIGDHGAPETIAVIDRPGDPRDAHTRGVFATEFANDLALGAAQAASLNVPLYVYRDRAVYGPDPIYTQPGVTILPALRCYPERVNGDWATPAARIDAVEPQVTAAEHAGYRGQIAMVLPVYTGSGAWSVEHAIALIKECATRLAGRIRVYVLFEQARGATDGIAHVPAFAQTAANHKAACALPAPVVTHQPPPVVETPTPTPPPVEPPMPTQPTIQPPSTQEEQLRNYHAPKDQPPGPGYVWMAGHWVYYGAGAASAAASMAANAAAQSATPTAPVVQATVSIPLPLYVDGPILRTSDGRPFQSKGFSCFTVLQRMRNGEDIDPTLDEYVALGYNTGVIFCQFRFMNWPRIDSFIATPAEARTVADRAARKGLYIRPIFLADCETDTGDGYQGFGQSRDQRVQIVRGHVDGLTGAPNVTGVVMNEPFANGGDAVDVARAAGLFDARPFPLALGLYPETGQEANFPVLDFIVDHPPRKPTWATEAGKIGFYVYQQCGVPWIADEWAKFAPESNPDGEGTEFDPVESPRRAEEAAAGCALSGAGFTFHSVSGIHAQPLSPLEHLCAQRASAAMDLIPADAALGEYTHDGLANCPLAPIGDVSIVGEIAGRVMGSRAVVVGAMPSSAWQPVARDGWRITDRQGELGQIVFLER